MEIPQGNNLYSYLYLNKQKCHVFLFSLLQKSENRRVEQILLRGKSLYQWEGGTGREKG
jgi:hypothetical protein